MPKVSVIVPNYNHAPYLEKRLQSILDQTYQDFEIIFLDDASKDNSLEIFSKFSDDSRICSIINKSNSGSPFKQWNKGLEKARGEYIWIAESDDYAAPIFLETLVAFLDSNPQVGLAYCQSYIVDEKSNILKTNHWRTDELSRTRWQDDFINNGIDECKEYLCTKNTIPNASAVLFRKNLLNKVGITEQEMSLCGDWMTWIKVLFKSNIAYSSQILNYYRNHCSSARKKCDQLQLLVEYTTINSMLQNQLGLSPKIIQARQRIIQKLIDLICNPTRDITISKKMKSYLFLRKLKSNIELVIIKKIIINYCSFYLSRIKNKLRYLVYRKN